MPYPNVIVLQNEISREFPSFRVRKKSESTLMRLIAWVLLVLTFGKNKDFMTRFITTIGTTVYVPDDRDARSPVGQCLILRHERVHMRQAAKYGSLLFSFLYLFWPIPIYRAVYRRKFEQEAYEESLRAMLEYGEDPSNFVVRMRMVMHFTTSEYFWMWTNEKDIEEWFDRTVTKVMNEKKN